jgi:glycerol-3-phosphate dehydrogenase
MKRNLIPLSNQIYDLVIVGSGIYGACLAWEASLRGLSVAIIDQADFGAATSANSLKIIHGGLRYLQTADFKRMRESIQERTALMRIAPHLVHPLPVLVPIYGHGKKGKEVMQLGMKLNDLISCDRNKLADPQKHIPNGRIISTQDCQKLLPNLPSQGLTGGAIFCDAQVYNSERLTLLFLQSAEQIGAAVANYVKVTGFLQAGNCVTGVQAKDILTGNQFEIRAKTVVNTCGPWLNRVLGLVQQPAKIQLAKAMNLVLRRSLFETYAVGLSSRNCQNQSSRFLFIAPWRNKSMVGTYYTVCNQDPDDFQITNQDILNFLNQINQTYPSANLKLEDVAFVHGGLLPQSDIKTKTGEPLLSKHYQLRDHAQEGLNGLISVVGVKYTTARDVAQKTVDLIFKSWGQKPPQSVSTQVPLYGGKIENFTSFLNEAINNSPYGLSKAVVSRLVYNYGSAYPNVLQYLRSERKPGYCSRQSDERAVLQAEVLHAVDREMAQKLSDVVLRRTELGSAGHPGEQALKLCAETMGKELGWSDRRIKQEIEEVNRVYPSSSLTKV